MLDQQLLDQRPDVTDVSQAMEEIDRQADLERREAERVAKVKAAGRTPTTRLGQWKARAVMLYQLDAVGGKLEPAKGKTYVPHARIMSVLGVSTGTLAIAEKDGVIARRMNSRRTQGIYLTAAGRELLAQFDPVELDAEIRQSGKTKKKASKTAERPADAPKMGRPRKVQSVAPHPPLGESVRVAGVDIDRTGALRLRIENETGSWLVAIEAYSQL